MKNLIEKFSKIEQKISKEKGDFEFFALFLREDAIDKWDIVVAADWIKHNKWEVMQYVAGYVQRSLDVTEIVNISKIVIIDEDNPELPMIQNSFHIEHGAIEIKDYTFFGLSIKHAFIITSASQKQLA